MELEEAEGIMKSMEGIMLVSVNKFAGQEPNIRA